MRWRVDVRGHEIAPNVQLDFTPEGTNDRQPMPSLSAGDVFYLVFSNNNRRGGNVIEAGSDTAIIEVANARWRVRRASSAEDLIPPAHGTQPSVWIVGAKL
jgi:hypothetical protein